MKQAQEASTNTATQILDVAERLVQIHGFNAFSYADIAGELGLTNAALHYHFPSKAELGEALIARYAIRFMGALADIDESLTDPLRKLDAYAGLYGGVLRRRGCACVACWQPITRRFRPGCKARSQTSSKEMSGGSPRY